MSNSCEECTACCRALGYTHEGYSEINPNVIPSLEVIAREGVVFDFGTECNKVCDTGCSIYENRPPICMDFNCAYITHNLNIKYRPDKCGFIAEGIDDTVLFTPIDHARSSTTLREYMSTHKEILTRITKHMSANSSQKYVRYNLQRS